MCPVSQAQRVRLSTASPPRGHGPPQVRASCAHGDPQPAGSSVLIPGRRTRCRIAGTGGPGQGSWVNAARGARGDHDGQSQRGHLRFRRIATAQGRRRHQPPARPGRPDLAAETREHRLWGRRVRAAVRAALGPGDDRRDRDPGRQGRGMRDHHGRAPVARARHARRLRHRPDRVLPRRVRLGRRACRVRRALVPRHGPAHQHDRPGSGRAAGLRGRHAFFYLPRVQPRRRRGRVIGGSCRRLCASRPFG